MALTVNFVIQDDLVVEGAYAHINTFNYNETAAQDSKLIAEFSVFKGQSAFLDKKPAIGTVTIKIDIADYSGGDIFEFIETQAITNPVFSGFSKV